MNVSLTPELENLVNEKVKSGLYNSASEVIRESLRLLQEQDMLKEFRRNELRREIMLGVDQIRNGEYTEIKSPEELKSFTEGIIKEAREKYAQQNHK
jgi:antitoxin ParD1/3/4